MEIILGKFIDINYINSITQNKYYNVQYKLYSIYNNTCIISYFNDLNLLINDFNRLSVNNIIYSKLIISEGIFNTASIISDINQNMPANIIRQMTPQIQSVSHFQPIQQPQYQPMVQPQFQPMVQTQFQPMVQTQSIQQFQPITQSQSIHQIKPVQITETPIAKKVNNTKIKKEIVKIVDSSDDSDNEIDKKPLKIKKVNKTKKEESTKYDENDTDEGYISSEDLAKKDITGYKISKCIINKHTYDNINYVQLIQNLCDNIKKLNPTDDVYWIKNTKPITLFCQSEGANKSKNKLIELLAKNKVDIFELILKKDEDIIMFKI